MPDRRTNILQPVLGLPRSEVLEVLCRELLSPSSEILRKFLLDIGRTYILSLFPGRDHSPFGLFSERGGRNGRKGEEWVVSFSFPTWCWVRVVGLGYSRVVAFKFRRGNFKIGLRIFVDIDCPPPLHVARPA